MFFTIKKIWDGLPVFTQKTIYHVCTEMRQTLACTTGSTVFPKSTDLTAWYVLHKCSHTIELSKLRKKIRCKALPSMVFSSQFPMIKVQNKQLGL